MTGREWFRFGLFAIFVVLIALSISRSKISIEVNPPPAETAKAAS